MDITNFNSQTDVRIQGLEQRQTDIANTLKEAKDNVSENLINLIIEQMGEEGFINNKEYQDTIGNTGNKGTRTQQKRWIGKLAKERQIELLIEYSVDLIDNEGINNWQSKLYDAQDAKDRAKAAMKEEAERVIAEYRKIIEDNEKIIEKLEAKIEKKEQKIESLTNKIMELYSRTDHFGNPLVTSDKTAETFEKEKNRLEDELKVDKENLDKLIEANNKYKGQVEKAILEFEKKLANENTLYVGSFKKEESEQEESQEQESYQGYDNEEAPNNARIALTNISNKSPKEFMDLMDGKTYQDMIDMTKNLGPLNRVKLKRTIENRFNDLSGGLQFTVNGNSVTISKKELQDLGDIDPAKFKSIIEKINEYETQYDTMPVHERKQADEQMRWLKLAILHSETRSGRLGRWFRGFSKNGSRITEFGNQLSQLAEKQQMREDSRYKHEDSLRERLKVKTPMKRRNVRVFNTKTPDKEWTR